MDPASPAPLPQPRQHNADRLGTLTNPTGSGADRAGAASGNLLARWPLWLLLGTTLAWLPRAPLDAYEPVKLGLAAIVVGLALLAGAPFRRLPSALMTAIGSSLVVLVTTALLAPDWAQFWTGSPQRSQGGLALLLALLVFWLAASTGPGVRTTMLQGMVLATILIGVLTLLQALGMDPLRTGSSRPPASLGNPMLLGQWLVLALPLCAWASCHGPWRQLARLATLLGVLALLLCGARAALLALLFVSGIAALAWSGRTRRVLAGVVLSLGLLLAALTASWRPASIEHRRQLWSAAIELIAVPPASFGPTAQPDRWSGLRPWLGYGADLQVIALRETAAATRMHFGADPDRAHQLLLDGLLRHGLLGLLAMLAVAGCWWRIVRTQTDRTWNRVVLVCLASWVLSMQSGFALTADALSASLIAGIALRPAAGRPTPARWPVRSAGLILVLLALGLWLLPPQWSPLKSWRSAEIAVLEFDQARRLLASASPAPAGCAEVQAALQALQRAASMDRWRPEYPQFAEATALAVAGKCQRNSQKQ